MLISNVDVSSNVSADKLRSMFSYWYLARSKRPLGVVDHFSLDALIGRTIAVLQTSKGTYSIKRTAEGMSRKRNATTNKITLAESR